MAARVFDLMFRSTANMAGVQQVNAGLQQTGQAAKALQQTLNEAGASFAKIGRDSDLAGLSANVDRIRAQFGETSKQAIAAAGAMSVLQKTSEAIAAKQAGGKLTDEDAALRWAKALGAAENRLVGLEQKTKSAAQANTIFGNSMNKTIGDLRIGNERAVMMAQAMGGLASQSLMGADATQLMASGATSLAMIMSTGGPWGIAIGMGIQLLATLGMQYKKTSDEAAAAAEKEKQAARSRVNELLNVRAAQYDWKESIEQTTHAYDKLIAKQEVALTQNERERASETDALARRHEIEEQEDNLAVEEGRMSNTEAEERKWAREYDRAQQKLEFELEAADGEEKAAQSEINKLVGEKSAKDEAARREEQRYQDVLTANQQFEAAHNAGGRIDARQTRIDEAEQLIDAAKRDPVVGMALVGNDDVQNIDKLRSDQERDLKAKRAAEDAGQEIRAKYPDLDAGPKGLEDQKARRDQAEEARKKASMAWDERSPQLADNVLKARDRAVNAYDENVHYLNKREIPMERGMRDAGKRDAEKNLQSAQGDKDAAQRNVDQLSSDLQAGLRELADKVSGTHAEAAQQLNQAAASLSDGATQQELQRVGSLMESAVTHLTGGIRSLAAQMDRVSSMAAAAMAQVTQAESRISAMHDEMKASK